MFGTPDNSNPNNNAFQEVEHNYIASVKPFFVDEAEVTNADYKRFLDATGYRPKQSSNFLAHWTGGNVPSKLADCPVVYIDIDDARAYAKWAGKRLPKEEEWQLAAQGRDGRKWPWGHDYDATRCNTRAEIARAKSYPEGKSPYGCYQMTGNVWELTESERTDGHTRFLILRGGSFMDITGSVWYMIGGPRPLDYHAKMIQMWPGLDRCSTIGFRCVKDVDE
jgi:formylglycine-generating enzyme required for sulfatase activity